MRCELWLTHPALDEIGSWDLTSRQVLEWGSGSSTVWWLHHGTRVYSVEDDVHWARWVASKEARRRGTQHNLQISVRPLEYPELYAALPVDLVPDIVVIDGHWRLQCLRNVLQLPGPFCLIIDNWQQDGRFVSETAVEWLRPFGGRSYPQLEVADMILPWQTTIWDVEPDRAEGRGGAGARTR